MSKPGEAEALNEFPDDEEVSTPSPAEKTTKSFEEQVNEALKGMKEGEDGKMHFEEGLPEDVVFAANAERRRRDTESSLSKERQKNAALEAKTEKYFERITSQTDLGLSTEEAEELEDLKRENPDAWRAKLNEYEERAHDKLLEELEVDDEEAEVFGEIERRAEVLQDFLDKNPGLVLNDEVFENDLPPRITGKLESGEVTFEEFLKEAKEYLQPKTKIKDSGDEEPEPNLGKAGGGSTAQDIAVESDIVESYKDEIY